MTSGRRDLERAAAPRPGRRRRSGRAPAPVSAARRSGHRRRPPAPRPCPARRSGGQLGSVGRRVAPASPGTRRGLGRVGDRDHDCRTPSAGRRQHGRQHPAHRTHRAVQTELADVDDSAPRRRRHEPAAASDGDGDGQVEAVPTLGIDAGRQVDRDAPLGHRHLRSCAAAALIRSEDCLTAASRQAADHEPGNPWHTCASTSTTSPCSPRSPPTWCARAPRRHRPRCSSCAGPDGRAQDGDDVDAQVEHRARARRGRRSQQPASRRSRRCLLQSPPRTGAPKRRRRRVLTSQTTRHVAVDGRRCRSRPGRTASCGRGPPARLDQVARGQPLAVRPHLAGHLVRHPTRPAPSPHPDHLRHRSSSEAGIDGRICCPPVRGGMRGSTPRTTTAKRRGGRGSIKLSKVRDFMRGDNWRDQGPVADRLSGINLAGTEFIQDLSTEARAPTRT